MLHIIYTDECKRANVPSKEMRINITHASFPYNYIQNECIVHSRNYNVVKRNQSLKGKNEMNVNEDKDNLEIFSM